MKRKLQQDKRNGNYFVWIRRDGVRRYFRFRANKRAAEKELEQVERDIAAGRTQFAEQETSLVVRSDGSRDVRIEELAVRHLEWVQANRASGTFLLRQHIVSLFVHHAGAKMVSDLTLEAIEDFLAWYRSRERKNGPQVGAGTHALREVRSMLRWGDEHVLCQNPIRRWPKVQKPPPCTRHWCDEDFGKLVKAVPDDFADLLVCGVLTGLRPKELRCLRRQDVIDQDGRKYVHIEHHKTSESSRVPVPRTVPLSAEAAEIVERQLRVHPKSDFVFLNDDGKPYSANALRKRLQRWCRRAGVPVMPPYALRHVFGTRQGRNGTNQAILAQLMGHSNLQTSMRYIMNCDPAHTNAVDMMESRMMPIVEKARAESAARKGSESS